MILKSYETEKINLEYSQLILFYGKNDGLKNEAIKRLIKEKKQFQIMKKKKY